MSWFKKKVVRPEPKYKIGDEVKIIRTDRLNSLLIDQIGKIVGIFYESRIDIEINHKFNNQWWYRLHIDYEPSSYYETSVILCPESLLKLHSIGGFEI